jgi:hypothetical protein
LGDIAPASAWQGDNAGMSASLGTTVRADMGAGANANRCVTVGKSDRFNPV